MEIEREPDIYFFVNVFESSFEIYKINKFEISTRDGEKI